MIQILIKYSHLQTRAQDVADAVNDRHAPRSWHESETHDSTH